MPRFIVRLAEDKYVEWSTIVDAPVTFIVSREQMLQYLDSWHGHSSYAENRARLDRADKNGTSAMSPLSMEELIRENRAGEKEKCISLEEIIERYHPRNAGKV